MLKFSVVIPVVFKLVIFTVSTFDWCLLSNLQLNKFCLTSKHCHFLPHLSHCFKPIWKYFAVISSRKRLSLRLCDENLLSNDCNDLQISTSLDWMLRWYEMSDLCWECGDVPLADSWAWLAVSSDSSDSCPPLPATPNWLLQNTPAFTVQHHSTTACPSLQISPHPGQAQEGEGGPLANGWSGGGGVGKWDAGA